MPRFAANLAYMFTERPLIERFGAAKAAGFKAVELQFPYEVAPSAIRAELERHGLVQLGINTQPRPNGGESGLGAVPGREREFAEVFKQALDYTVAVMRTPVEVTDELFARVHSYFDDRQLVEITALLTLVNLDRFNAAFGIGAAGFSDGMVCVPPDRPATVS